jgi:hypothetical protein
MQAAAGLNQINTSQLPVFKFDGDNRLEFLSGFPDVAAHFGFSPLIYGEEPLPRPDDAGPEQTEWDRLNELAKSKLRFYITKGVYNVVWMGENLTALELKL